MDASDTDGPLQILPEPLDAPPVDNLAADLESTPDQTGNIEDDIEMAIEQEFAIDDAGSVVEGYIASETPPMESSDVLEEMEVESGEQNQSQLDLPTEAAPGWDLSADNGFSPEATNAVGIAQHSALPSSAPIEPGNDGTAKGGALAIANSGANANLPTIIHQVGNRRQQQPAPVLIRMPRIFETDTRVVVNPMFERQFNQDLTTPPMATQNIAAPSGTASPRAATQESWEQPYQIRTTALPSLGETANDNDFVPKR